MSESQVEIYGYTEEDRKKRTFEIMEPALLELAELVNTGRLDESPEVYKRYPEFRCGIRIALMFLEKRGDIKSRQ